MTRARKWQLKQRALGNCMWCGNPANGFARCAIHRAWFRGYAKGLRVRNIETNRERERASYHKRRQADPERFRLKSRKRYANNPVRARELATESRNRNVAAARARDRARSPQKNKRMAERFKADPMLRLEHRLRNRISSAIRRSASAKSDSSRVLFGCSTTDLMIYLESKFEPGMSWQNYGNVWHVDHIMPCAIFDFSKPEHQRRCFHFSNLQPLFARDNLSKNAKVLTDQFQLI